MSYDSCKYCNGIAGQKDKNDDFVCFNRINTGHCNREYANDYKEPKRYLELLKPYDECGCGSGRKNKFCCKTYKNE